MSPPGPPQHTLVFAQTYTQAQHWARERSLSPLRWTYVVNTHHVRGRYGPLYVVLDDTTLNPQQYDALEYVRHVADGVPWTSDPETS